VVQQVAWAQHVVCAQHALPDAGQHDTAGELLLTPSAASIGIGQQGGTIIGLVCGQTTCGTLPAAPAGPSIARTQNAAARNRSDDGRIKRRIAKPGWRLPVFVKTNATTRP
jgi:hypothetical protein